MTEGFTPRSAGPPGEGSALSRRWLFKLAGAGAAIGAAGFAGGIETAHASAGPDEPDRVDSFAFFGAHQSGIVTPAQDRLHFASFDVTATTREELVGLLQDWTAAAEQMTRGDQIEPAVASSYAAPPPDTGEAEGLPASRLTLTFGFGPSLFRDGEGQDRFGIAERQPTELRVLPHFPADNLNTLRSNGDLCVQACADDPQVAVHAIRNLSRIAFGRASLRWSQLGFGRTSSTSTSQSTPRNLFGFKDGTANLKAEQTDQVDEHLWVGSGDDRAASWLAGGSYLVARRINMHIETWDRTSLQEQEQLTGRDRPHGAPLSGGTEFTALDLEVKGSSNQPLIAQNAHVRLAHPSQNGGARMLRRGYNFTDGNDELGRLDAGLFFIAYVRSPQKQYVPMQNKLAREDGLMEYLQHTGSALFAVPPGATRGGYVGEQLFA